tara:strand:- start:71390 stop:73627 length:2238 start_codon:yes stop_codon:yes gene_type:complete
MKITSILFSLFCFLLLPTAYSDEGVPQLPVKTSASIVHYGQQKYLAVHFINHPHWHTYWRNPGDAGLPTKIEFSDEADALELTEMPWPTPKRFIEKGNILAYGYDDGYSRFYKINSSTLPNIDFTITSTWLVCKHICIPGRVQMKTILEDGNLKKVIPSHMNVDQSESLKRLSALPSKSEWPSELDIILKKTKKENQLALYYNTQGEKSSTTLYKSSNLLFPISAPLISFGHESLYYNKSLTLSGRMFLEWDGEYETPPQQLPSDGQFETPLKVEFLYVNPITKKGTIVTKTFSSFQKEEDDKMNSFLGLLTQIIPNGPDTIKIDLSNVGDTQSNEEESENSFWKLLLFGFLGGLILNIMPCVLPVISLKLFGLIIHSDESHKKILKHNIFYTLGVLSTFMVLALVIIFVKSSGESIGWGFQLQSPTFVMLMILLLFIMALNLFGLFEFYTPGGKKLGNVALKKGFFGDFAGGILATILATPCSAPFLGAALTFAFSSSPLGIISIFMSIGLGLSFPFLLTGMFPKTINFLPRPGLWMEKVKKFLGLTLLFTLIWLVDVYVALTNGGLSLLKLNSIIVTLFFAVYFFKRISNNKLLQVIFFLIPLGLSYSLIKSHFNIQLGQSNSSQIIQDKSSMGLDWKPWSEEAMENLKNEQKLVFIDFTAKWCFTCKVNEKIVLDTDKFRKLVKDRDIHLLLGDWTKKDPKITSFLKKHKLVGVPAYFIQRPNGEIIKLGETITIKEIAKNL